MKTFKYYSSDLDRNINADKNGWWIAYETIFGDMDACHIVMDKESIGTKEEALELLKEALPDDWENGIFTLKVINFGFNEIEDGIFTIKINREQTKIETRNIIAEEFKQRWNKEFPNKSMLYFILNTPNQLDKIKDGSLTYTVDLSYEEETMKELRRILKEE